MFDKLYILIQDNRNKVKLQLDCKVAIQSGTDDDINEMLINAEQYGNSKGNVRVHITTLRPR